MLRWGASVAAAAGACLLAAGACVAQDSLDVQSCESAHERAGPGETAFEGVGVLQRLSWSAERSPVSDTQLRVAAAPWAGAPLNIVTVRCVALAMEGVFRDAGYPYSRVSAPPQRVEAGLVRYQVVEGWVERVTPTGDDARARLEAHRWLRSLEGGEEHGPLALRAVERAAALLDEAPGLESRMAITRGGEDQTGAVRIVVESKRKSRNLVVNVNNFGAEELGRTGAAVLFRTSGRAPLGDELTVSLFSTADVREQHAVRATYLRALTSGGVLAHAEIAYGEAAPGGEVSVLNAAAQSFSTRFELSMPVLLGRRTRVHAGAGLDTSDQSGELFGGQISLSEDSTRNAFARVEFESSPGCVRFTSTPDGACWRFAGEFEARKGLDGLGASAAGDADLARPFADPQAAVWRGALQAESPNGPWGMRARLQLSGQATDRPLMAFEEFNIGNYTLVRGYDPGALAGDSGLSSAAELIGPRFNFRRTGLVPFAFYDAARIWNEDPGAPNGRYVASYGAGFRVEIERGARFEATWAHPMYPPLGLGESTPSSRVLFSLTTSVTALLQQPL